jgi:hypothetical protein
VLTSLSVMAPLPQSLSPERADALAATFEPSWRAHFGEPLVAPGAPAVVSAKPVVAVEGVNTPASVRGAAKAVNKPGSSKPARSTSSAKRDSKATDRKAASSRGARSGRRSAVEAAPMSEPVDLPTEEGSGGKVIGLLFAAAAIIGLIFMLTRGDDPETQSGSDKPTTTAKPKATATPPPTPEPPPAATTPEPAKTAEPAPEPAPTEEPAPKVEPKPAPKPGPLPKPGPKPKPKPRPKPGGGIIQDVPF